MKPRPRPSAAAMIDDDFLRTFEHLARADAPAITALLPEIAAFPPHHHLSTSLLPFRASAISAPSLHSRQDVLYSSLAPLEKDKALQGDT